LGAMSLNDLDQRGE